MKRYIKYSEPIVAMAIINPQMCKGCSIRIEVVQSNEVLLPHVHVYSGGGKSGKCSYVSLTKAEYPTHHSDCPRLTKNEKAEFIKIMSSIWNKYAIELHELDDNGNSTDSTYLVKATGYEAAVQIWCDTYERSEQYFEFDESGRPMMPNYNDLDVSR